jgi:hypothetical protein
LPLCGLLLSELEHRHGRVAFFILEEID